MAFNTKINLDNGKVIQQDGCQLTLSGDTSIASVGRLAYLTNQSAVFNVTPLAVPDVQWVTGRTSTSGIQTATNGLTKQGTEVKLGGALTGTTTINGAQTLRMNVSTLSLTGATGFNLSTGCGLITATNSKGLEYVANYNATFDNESLITKRYVCSQTSGITSCAITTASNGLTKQGQEVKLGGTLTGTTTLTSAGGTALLQYGSDYSLNYVARTIPDAAFVTGRTCQAIVSACNGLTKVGTGANSFVKLGGSLTGNTCITGAYLLGINTNQLNFSGATGGVNLGGSGLYFKGTIPGSGGLLCLDGSNQVSQTSLASFGGITGATNGLTDCGSQRIGLGGTLCAGTSIIGAQALCLGTAASRLASLDLRPSGALTIVAGTLPMSASGATFTDLTLTTKQGIKYNADYSLTYNVRSLVDKGYVDTVATGLQVHAAAIVATTVPITLSTNKTIDGVLTTTGMRVLVKNQSDAKTNGIYSANTGDWGRTADFDASVEISNGDLIPVTSGSTQNSTVWVLTSMNPITLGTTDLTFTLFSTIVDIQAGQGIAITQVGGVHTACVFLPGGSGAACGLAVSALGLCVDQNIAGCALSYSSGVLSVNAASCGSTPAIPVGYNAGSPKCLVVACSDIITALGTPINTAVNGLTKQGSEVKLGGTITGATTLTLGSGGGSLLFTDSRIAPSSVGLQYTGNYGPYFTALSIPDAQWVTGKTSTSGIQSACNGLTKSGTMVKLGGALTGTTTINGAQTLRVNTCYFNVTGTTGLCISTGNGVITDTGNKGGLQYAAVYDPYVVALSIPNAAWVTGKTSTSGIQSACNGLTKSGTMVKLGGALTGSTTINGASTLRINQTTLSLTGNTTFGLTYGTGTITNVGGTTALVYGAYYGATNVAQSIPDAQWVTGNTATALTNYVNNAGNGLTKAGKYIILGGALTGTTTINGAQTLRINVTTLNLSGNTSLNLTGTAVTLQTTPPDGVISDSVLVWNSVDKQIKKVSGAALGDKNNVYSKTIVSANATGTTASTYVQLISGATSFTLPSAPIAGQAFKIKDAAGNALSNNIVVNAGSGKTIDGSQCALINTDFGALELVYGATNKWFSLAFVN